MIHTPMYPEWQSVQYREREFTCPNCGQNTIVITPMEFLIAKRTECSHCGKEFVIEHDQPKRLTS